MEYRIEVQFQKLVDLLVFSVCSTAAFNHAL